MTQNELGARRQIRLSRIHLTSAASILELPSVPVPDVEIQTAQDEIQYLEKQLDALHRYFNQGE
jgi:hypothetical protein